MDRSQAIDRPATAGGAISSDGDAGHPLAGQTVLFLTGHLAERALYRELESAGPWPFVWRVHDLGLSVAALMTTEMVARRLTDVAGVDRIIVPGRCRGDVEALSATLGVPVERGPEELKDLPRHLGRLARPVDLSRHACTIFAEIVDAPELDVGAILARARDYAAQGADVIDLGCMPATPFDHLEEAIGALHAAGFRVSVDSASVDDLRRAGRAGADYLLSLNEHTVGLLDEVASVPVLVPATPGDVGSLERAIDEAERRGRAFLADPILDPVHFGFVDSVVRYHTLRRRRPQVPILMGVGNLTELVHADTAGINALLFGMVSEMRIEAVLTTSVSPHARSAIREADVARRVMRAAREDGALPRHYSDELMMLHERAPFPESDEEIRDLAAQVRDPNYRIRVGEHGVYLYNRDGLSVATDPFDFYAGLNVAGDPGHAFYLGVELGRAQIAWTLGKRYAQDEPLGWGAASERPAVDLTQQKSRGSTLAGDLSHTIRGVSSAGARSRDGSNPPKEPDR